MRETTRNCFQVVPARSAENGHEKCGRKMTKHGIRINTFIARLFPVYGSELRKRNWLRVQQRYISQVRTRIIANLQYRNRDTLQSCNNKKKMFSSSNNKMRRVSIHMLYEFISFFLYSFFLDTKTNTTGFI